jgi:hypothetical protein
MKVFTAVLTVQNVSSASVNKSTAARRLPRSNSGRPEDRRLRATGERLGDALDALTELNPVCRRL